MCDYGVEIIGVQQGWQCPICKRVYAPNTPMCYYCGNGEQTTTTTWYTGTGYPLIDWTKHISKTVPDGSSQTIKEVNT